MNSHKNKKDKRNHKAWEYSESAMFTNSIASMTECTGMTPTVPETEEEAASYHAMLDVPVTAKDGSESYTKIRKK